MIEDSALDAQGPPCPICAQLGDYESGFQKYLFDEQNYYIPSAAARLEVVRDFTRPYSSRLRQLKQCPECGRYYLYTTDYEFLIGGSEDEQVLERLSAEQAAEYLNEP
jgi:hypothetical protein